MSSPSQSQKLVRPPVNASNTWIIRNARELIGYYDRYGIEDWLDEVVDTGISPQNLDTIHSTMRGHPAGRPESYDPNSEVLSLDTVQNLESIAAEIEAETERRSSVLYGHENKAVRSSATPSEQRTEPGSEIDNGSLRLVRYLSHSNDRVSRLPARPEDGSLHTDVEDDDDDKHEPPVYRFDDRDLIRGEYFPCCPSPLPAIRRASSHTSLSTTSSLDSIPESHDPHRNFFVYPSPVRPGVIMSSTDDENSPPQPLPPNVLRPIPHRVGRLLVPQSSRADRRGSPLIHRNEEDTKIPTLTTRFEKTKVVDGDRRYHEDEKEMRLPKVYSDALA